VKKTHYARRNFYDLWLPELAPSQKWVSWALSRPWSDERWAKYVKNYRREMNQPDRQRLIKLLAGLSRQSNFSVGCYCADESRCHRSILRGLLAAQGAKITGR
jgi:uncharacterized protein YeaO (DUF488 family)